MAEHSTRATGENRSHPATMWRKRWSTDGIDAPVNQVQATDEDPVFDRLGRKAEVKQLAARDHIVLLLRQSPCFRRPRLVSWGPHRGPKSPIARALPPTQPVFWGACGGSDHAEAAADAQGLAGDVRSVVRGQERGGGGYLLGLA